MFLFRLTSSTPYALLFSVLNGEGVFVLPYAVIWEEYGEQILGTVNTPIKPAYQRVHPHYYTSYTQPEKKIK